MWRRAALALLALTGGCARGDPAAPPALPAHPLRVMSLNQCTDQLVLALLPPARIASVTWLSRDPRYSALAAAAQAVPVNHGGVEEVVRAKPDLIVTDTFSNPAGRALLHRLGYPVLELADAGDAAAIRANVRTLAAAVDARARGEALIADMDAALAPPAGKPVRVAVWSRDGMGAGPLMAMVLKAAGAVDVGTGGSDIESLIAARPDVLVASEAADATLGDARAAHPLVRRLWPAARRATVRQAEVICGTPAIGDAARALRERLGRAGGGL